MHITADAGCEIVSVRFAERINTRVSVFRADAAISVSVSAI